MQRYDEIDRDRPFGSTFPPACRFPCGERTTAEVKKKLPFTGRVETGTTAPAPEGAAALFHHRRSAPPVYEDTERNKKHLGLFLDEPATLPASVVASAPLSALQANPGIQLDLFGHDIQQLSSHRVPLRRIDGLEPPQKTAS